MWQWQRAALTVCNVWIDLQIGPIVDVSGFPLLLISLKLTAVANKWCLGCQRQHLCFLRNPIIVHTLGVFRVSHQTADVHPAIYLKFVAYNTDNGDIFTRPVLLFQHLKTVGFAPFDPFYVHIPRFDGFQAHHFSLFRFGRTNHRGDAAVVHVQFLGLMLDVEILGNPHRVLVDPSVQLTIPNAISKAGQG